MPVKAFRFAALAAVAFLAASCATTATNTLPQAKRDSLRIDAVELSFAPDGWVAWSDALHEFQASGVADTPEARREFLKRKAIGPIKAALDAEIIPAFRGNDRARLKVVVRSVSVPSALQRILVGGQHTIVASVQVVDARSGQTLVEAADFNGMSRGGAGPLQLAIEQAFPHPIDRVSRNFSAALKRWLQTGHAMADG